MERKRKTGRERKTGSDPCRSHAISCSALKSTKTKHFQLHKRSSPENHTTQRYTTPHHHPGEPLLTLPHVKGPAPPSTQPNTPQKYAVKQPKQTLGTTQYNPNCSSCTQHHTKQRFNTARRHSFAAGARTFTSLFSHIETEERPYIPRKPERLQKPLPGTSSRANPFPKAALGTALVM